MNSRDPDRVEVEINGSVVQLYQSYEVKVSVMTQPAAFSVRLGGGSQTKEILERVRPGNKFQLRIDGTPIQTGLVESVDVMSGEPSTVEIRGRDNLLMMVKSRIEKDTSFMRPTYFELVRAVMDLCGMKDIALHAGNGANVKTTAKVVRQTAKTAGPTDAESSTEVESRETNIPAQATGGKVTYQALRAKLAQSWFEWLQKQLKLAGLFLWCGADGTVILAELSTKSAPLFNLVRQRGAKPNAVNVVSHTYHNSTEDRHARYVVHGRYGGGPGGRARFKGEWTDEEMVGWGFESVHVEQDDDIKSKKEADYLARRRCAEARRGGRQLSYTVRGHLVPQNLSQMDGGLWWPDTTADVWDDELGIHGARYIESVTYRRSQSTSTTLTLVDPEDLAFIAETPK